MCRPDITETVDWALKANYLPIYNYYTSAFQEVDIGLSDFDTNWKRSQLLDTLSPVVYSTFVMVYRKPEVADNFRMPLAPWSSTVVLSVAAAMVVVSLLLWALEMVFWASSPGGLDRSGGGSYSTRPKCSTTLLILDKSFELIGAAILGERKSYSFFLMRVTLRHLTLRQSRIFWQNSCELRCTNYCVSYFTGSYVYGLAHMGNCLLVD